jgi:hypothetical protein
MKYDVKDYLGMPVQLSMTPNKRLNISTQYLFNIEMLRQKFFSKSRNLNTAFSSQ